MSLTFSNPFSFRGCFGVLRKGGLLKCYLCFSCRLMETMRVIDDEICYKAKDCQYHQSIFVYLNYSLSEP